MGVGAGNFRGITGHWVQLQTLSRPPCGGARLAEIFGDRRRTGDCRPAPGTGTPATVLTCSPVTSDLVEPTSCELRWKEAAVPAIIDNRLNYTLGHRRPAATFQITRAMLNAGQGGCAPAARSHQYAAGGSDRLVMPYHRDWKTSVWNLIT